MKTDGISVVTTNYVPGNMITSAVVRLTCKDIASIEDYFSCPPICITNSNWLDKVYIPYA